MSGAKAERYAAYKDSGVEWLGEVPKHWEVKRVKELGSLVLGKMLDNMPEPSKVYKPYLKSKNIGWLKVTDSNIEEMYFSPYEVALYRIKKNDLLFSEGGEVGKTSIWNNEISECYIQNSVHKFTANKNNNPRYLLYLSFSAGQAKYYDSIVNFVSIKHLTKDKLSRVEWLSPPLPEQTAIATYLDTKTSQIDRQIELLDQKATQYGKLKQSHINETVTRGLDKTVPMKDSEVEWIGSVPEHWEVKHFKQFSTMKGRIGWQGLKHAEFIDEGPFLITGMNFKVGKINWDEVYHITNERYKQAPEIQLRENDVLMTKDGTIGKLLFVEEIPAPHKASLNSHLLVFRPIRKSYYPKYLYYQLDSSLFQDYVEVAKAGTTFFGISQAAVGRYIGILPPLSEQIAIAVYLDEKIAQIDRIVTTINSLIDKLKILKKTLITDVVTGKIKVVREK